MSPLSFIKSRMAVWLAMCLFPAMLHGQDSLNLMFYNLYRFPTHTPHDREYLLREIVAAVKPDLLMVCELVNEEGADRIQQASFEGLPDSFARASFVYCESAISDPLQQLVFYNTRKLILVAEEVIPTSVRDINHYTFALATTDMPQDSMLLHAFVTHFKSSTGSANEQSRLAMADSLMQAVAAIPADHLVVVAGDLNFYSAGGEPGYQRLLDSSNAVRLLDPVAQPGAWHNNEDFAAIHTQATRTSLQGFGLGGASGGLDDRFDFILISENLRNGSELTYREGSYRAVGNNGACFNHRIDDSSCTGSYPQQLRYYLHQMSDHTPVAMQLITNKHFLALREPKYSPQPWFRLAENPTGNTLTLLTDRNRAAPSTWAFIYDRMGRPAKSVRITGLSRQVIDISELPAGLYLIRIGQTVAKFIKR